MKGNRRSDTLHSPTEFILYIVTELKHTISPLSHLTKGVVGGVGKGSNWVISTGIIAH